MKKNGLYLQIQNTTKKMTKEEIATLFGVKDDYVRRIPYQDYFYLLKEEGPEIHNLITDLEGNIMKDLREARPFNCDNDFLWVHEYNHKVGLLYTKGFEEVLPCVFDLIHTRINCDNEVQLVYKNIARVFYAFDTAHVISECIGRQSATDFSEKKQLFINEIKNGNIPFRLSHAFAYSNKLHFKLMAIEPDTDDIIVKSTMEQYQGNYYDELNQILMPLTEDRLIELINGITEEEYHHRIG